MVKGTETGRKGKIGFLVRMIRYYIKDMGKVWGKV